MNKSVLCLFLANCLFFTWGCKPKAESGKVAIEAYFQQANQNNFVLSPDADHLASLLWKNNQATILLKNIASQQVTEVATLETDAQVSFFAFKNNQKLIYITGKGNNKQLFVLDIFTQKVVNLTPYKNSNAVIVSLFAQNSTQILVALSMRHATQPDAYMLNINTGAMQLLAQNTGNITQYFADHKGVVRLALAQTDHFYYLYSRQTNNQNFGEVLSFCPSDQLKPIDFDAENQSFYAISNLNRDKLALVRIDAQTGKENEVVYENENIDVYNAYYSHFQQKLCDVIFIKDEVKHQPLSAFTQKKYAQIATFFTEKQFVVVSTDSSETAFVLKTYDGSHLSNYFLYKNNHIEPLYNANEDLNLPQLSEVQAVNIPSCDGLAMQGYITQPQVRKKNMPFVVLIHRFSEGRVVQKYDAAAQFLASRGLGVLQLNFRGSTGYGKYFHNLGKKELGKKIECDIQDGVSWLVQKNYANAKKVAIIGENLGAFCAFNCLAQCPETFACAAGYSATLNLESYLQKLNKQPIATQNRLIENIGHPQYDSLALLERSPLFKAKNIQAPLMIYQNTSSVGVNERETLALIGVLKKNNIPTVYRFFNAEPNHEAMEKMQFYKDAEGFLAKYLK